MAKFSFVVFLLSLVFFLASALTYASIERIWFDESFSIEYASMDTWHILSPHDVHPPTYYIILSDWMAIFGYDEFGLRLLSIVFGAVTVLFLYLIFLKIAPDSWIYFIILYTLSTTAMHYFTEIRMYAMGIMLCTISFYIMLNVIEKGKGVTSFFIIAFTMLITHYYTALFLATQMIYMVVSMRLKFFKVAWKQMLIFSVFCIGLLFYFGLQRMRLEALWYQPSSWYSIFSTYYSYIFYSYDNVLTHNATMVGVFFLVFCFFLFSWSIGNSKSPKYMYVMLLFLLMPPFIGMIINEYVMRVYHHRLFIFGAWVFVALIAMSLTVARKKDKSIFWISLFMLSVVFFINIHTYWSGVENILKDAHSSLPCEEDMPVVHESIFSGLPSVYYNHLNGCRLRDYIYSSYPREYMNSAGYDALEDWRILSDIQFDEFYYYKHAGYFNESCLNYSVYYKGDGLSILRCYNVRKPAYP